MKGVGTALTCGLRAPLAQWRLVLLLWLARLLPILLAFGLPAFSRAAERSGNHPDAGLLLAPRADEGGFVHSWTSDLFRTDLAGVQDTIFWLILFCWVLVTVLAGGIIARMVHGSAGLFLAECGRYAGRFLRLAVVMAFGFYAIDLLLNGVLARAHEEVGREQFLQDFATRKGVVRGLLFLALLHILGAVHAYARIEIVAHERRSAMLSLLRALGTLVARLPKLLVVELGMLLLTGLALLLAWILMRAAAPAGPAAGWASIGIFIGLAALGSYLRTGVELGTLVARCALLAAPVAVVKAYQVETPPVPAAEPPDEEPDELELPPPAPAE